MINHHIPYPCHRFISLSLLWFSISLPLVADASRSTTTTINSFQQKRHPFVPRISRTTTFANPRLERKILGNDVDCDVHGDSFRQQAAAAAIAITVPRGGQSARYGGRGDDDDDGGGGGGGGDFDDDDYYYNERDGRYSSSPSRAARSDGPASTADDDYSYRNSDDYYYDDDRGGAPSTGGSPRSGTTSLSSRLPAIIRTGNRQIGLPLLGIGAALTVLGMSLFFNKTLMRLGNLFFVAGVPMTLGPGRTAGYFFQPKKARATACLALGLFLVFVGWPILGIVLEAFGLLNLFGNMFPLAMAVLKQMPVIGPMLRGEFGGGGRGGDNNPRRKSYDDDYYDDRYSGPDDKTYQDRDRYYDDPPNSYYGDERGDDNIQGYY